MMWTLTLLGGVNERERSEFSGLHQGAGLYLNQGTGGGF